MALTKVLSTTVDMLRGLVRVVATGLPHGDATVTRTLPATTPAIIRGGSLTNVLTGGFILQDPEPPFGQPLTYRVVSAPASRIVQINRILNPKAALNLTNWTTGNNRVLARETATALVPPRDAVTSIRIPANTAGTTYATLKDRLLASTVPDSMVGQPGVWFVSGQVRYDSPDLWLWTDVKQAGTWQAVKNVGTWQQVQTHASLQAGQPFATLWAAIVGPADTATVQRTNLVTNPEGVGTTGWTAPPDTGGGTETLSTATTGGPTAASPNYVRATWTAASTVAGAGGLMAGSAAAGATAMPVTVGTGYFGSLSVRPSKAQTLQARIRYYDNTGTLLSTVLGAATAVAATTWSRLSVNGGAAPAGAVRATLGVVPAATGALWAVNDTLDVSAALLEAATALGSYFSGATAATGPLTFGWSGTANASASTQSLTDLDVRTAPVQVLGVTTTGAKDWHTFQAAITVPAGLPAGSRLVFLHGTVVREFAATFWLSTIYAELQSEMQAGAITPYLDGDTPVPANPALNLAPLYDWKTLSHDAAISWDGAANGSVSRFTGPSQIYAEDVVSIGVPPTEVIPRVKQPIFLSDPVVPQLAQWFELLEIGDLGFAARAQLYDIVNKGAQIAVSQLRPGRPGRAPKLLTYTLEQASVVERMFASGRILFMRNPDPRFPESVWYLHIGDVTGRTARPQRGLGAGADLERPVRPGRAPGRAHRGVHQHQLAERQGWLPDLGRRPAAAAGLAGRRAHGGGLVIPCSTCSRSRCATRTRPSPRWTSSTTGWSWRTTCRSPAGPSPPTGPATSATTPRSRSACTPGTRSRSRPRAPGCGCGVRGDLHRHQGAGPGRGVPGLRLQADQPGHRVNLP
jgi:hypothetical protein